MGVFTHTVELSPTADGPFQGFEAVVDSGAIYTQVPASALRALGVEPLDRAPVELADGSIAYSDLGEAFVRIDGRVRRTICVFGEESAPAILGAYTLEAFLLGVDPVNRRLVPVIGMRLLRTRTAIQSRGARMG